MTEISGLSELALADDTDLIPIVDTDDLSVASTGKTKKIPAFNFLPGKIIPPSGDGTGATDVANINTALANGDPVFLRPGPNAYATNAPIIMQNQGHLSGFHWDMASQNDYYSAGTGNPTGAVIQTFSNFVGAAVIYLPDPGPGVQNYGVDISGISVVSFSSGVSGLHSMSVIGAWGACFLRGVQLQKGTQDCLHFDVGGTGAIPDDWQITDCKFSAARNGYGINIANNLADSWFDVCESSENHLDGIYSGWLDNTRFTTVKSENNGGSGWNLNSGSSDPAMLTTCTAQLNNQHGFIFGGSAPYVLTGCRSYQNSQGAGTYAGFYGNGATGLIMGTGCWAAGDAYGAWLGSSSLGMAFTGSYLTGTTAATFDDGTNTSPLINQIPSGSRSFGTGIAPGVFTLADAATVLVDASKGNDFRLTLGGSRTIGAPSNPTDGQEITFLITQPGAGGPYTPTFTSSSGGYSYGSGSAPSWSTGANATDMITFKYRAAATKWLFKNAQTGF